MPQRVASAGQGLVAGIAAASALILVAAAPTPTLKPQPSPTVNWNKFHLDLGNTAFNDQEKTLTKGTVKHLNLLWQFTTNGPIYGSPSVSGSRVLIGDSSGNLNWHGPAPLILHFHLDVEIPKGATATPLAGTKAGSTQPPAPP